MATNIVALIHREEGSRGPVYGISFPDFPGCVSAGASLEEAVARGQAALAFHVEGMVADGDPLRRPRSLDELAADDEVVTDLHDADLVVAVPFDLPGKAVRVNVSIDERLLESIDRAARMAGQSRSAFLAEAAKARIRGAA